VEPVSGGTLSFPGFYVLASRLLTGESRPYSAARGTFGSVRPRRPIFPGWGPGAWEVALRVSYVDLDSGEVRGGRLTSATVGVNWYLSSFLELRFNYVFASVGGRAPGGQVNIVQTRLGMSF
jgi:phosphate-selective porin OprO/OprP